MENKQAINPDLVKNTVNQQDNEEKLSDKAKTLVSLIVRILVNATLKECEGCNEKGNKISSV